VSAQSIERVYDRLAPVYGLWAELVEGAARRRARELAAARPGEAVLEVAVGTGKFFSELRHAQPKARRVGVDLSPGMLRRARRRMHAQGEREAALCQADARWLPFPDDAFDVLVNCYMLDLLPEEKVATVLAEFRRVLRPSGRLVVVVMGQQGQSFQALWMWLYKHAPTVVGGCRPVPLSLWLADGWKVEVHEPIVQRGFRSEVFLARPALRQGGAA